MSTIDFTITGTAAPLTLDPNPVAPGDYIAGDPSPFSASLSVDGSTVINPDAYSTSGPVTFSMNFLGQVYTGNLGGFWADHPCDCPLHEDAGMGASGPGVFFSLEYQTNPPTATTLGDALLQESLSGGPGYFSGPSGLYQLTGFTVAVTDIGARCRSRG